MQASIFLARLLGPAMLIVGIGVLINQRYYRGMTNEFVASRPLFYIASIIGVVGGLAIVLVHNVWVLNWRVLITLFGWIHFLRGVVTVLFPAQAMEFAGRHIAASNRVPLIPGSLAVILGAIFCFYGYF